MGIRFIEKAQATAGTAMAQSQMEHLRTYSRSRRPSRRKLREQAAEVLLLLQLPLSKAERMEFSALLERRIERAYGERRR